MKHRTYDEFWQARNLPKAPRRTSSTPVLTVGGWFDAEDLFGPLETYQARRDEEPGNATRLVIGPWSHGGWARGDGDSLGDITFGAKTASTTATQIELPFFDYHLKDKGADPRPRRCVFETGSNRWRTLDAWPPQGHASASAVSSAPTASCRSTPPPAEDGDAFDEYVSDPRSPCRTAPQITTTEGSTYMVDDQRFAARGPTCSSIEPSARRRTSPSPARSRRACTSRRPAPMPTGS